MADVLVAVDLSSRVLAVAKVRVQELQGGQWEWGCLYMKQEGITHSWRGSDLMRDIRWQWSDERDLVGVVVVVAVGKVVNRGRTCCC